MILKLYHSKIYSFFYYVLCDANVLRALVFAVLGQMSFPNSKTYFIYFKTLFCITCSILRFTTLKYISIILKYWQKYHIVSYILGYSQFVYYILIAVNLVHVILILQAIWSLLNFLFLALLKLMWQLK